MIRSLHKLNLQRLKNMIVDGRKKMNKIDDDNKNNIYKRKIMIKNLNNVSGKMMMKKKNKIRKHLILYLILQEIILIINKKS